MNFRYKLPPYDLDLYLEWPYYTLHPEERKNNGGVSRPWGFSCLTNKKAQTRLCCVVRHERGVGWTRAAGENFPLLLECSRHFLACFIAKQGTVLAFLFLLKCSCTYICDRKWFQFTRKQALLHKQSVLFCKLFLNSVSIPPMKMSSF